MILIADDNASMRRTIRSMLADVTDEFVECGDGQAAVDLYSRHHPAWVLMDIRMQPMDGITATRALIAAHPSARIIIVTNYDDPQLRSDARGAGACGYVLKDDLSELLDIITKEEL